MRVGNWSLELKEVRMMHSSSVLTLHSKSGVLRFDLATWSDHERMIVETNLKEFICKSRKDVTTNVAEKQEFY